MYMGLREASFAAAASACTDDGGKTVIVSDFGRPPQIFAKRPRNGRPPHPKPRRGAPAPYPSPDHTLAGSRAELQRPQRPNSRAVRAGAGWCQNGGVPAHPPLALATTTTLAQKVCHGRRPDFVSRSQACRALAPQSFGRALCTLFFYALLSTSN